jgi:hypothetical protein
LMPSFISYSSPSTALFLRVFFLKLQSIQFSSP